MWRFWCNFGWMRKLLFLQYAILAVVMDLFGLATFGLLMVDFLFPGTFKDWFLFQGGMELNPDNIT